MLISPLVSKQKSVLDFELLINCTFSLGYIAKDSSFYALLHAESSQQDRVISQIEMETSNSNATIEYRLVKLFLI
jgi:hypothetical protein